MRLRQTYNSLVMAKLRIRKISPSKMAMEGELMKEAAEIACAFLDISGAILTDGGDLYRKCLAIEDLRFGVIWMEANCR